MQVISHTFPGGAELCAYLHEADESMPASLRCEQPAVIIFPGGGYAFTSPREADPVALAFLSMGYQTFILRYRTGESAGAKQPLEDAARSIAFVREHSAEWHIDPEKIAVLGFSTGGTEVFNLEATSSSPTSIRMAVTVIGTVPILCVYPFLQKYFVKGMYVGAVKG